MKKFMVMICLFIYSLLTPMAYSADNSYVIVTASNDPGKNELFVYDSGGNFLQAIATNGKGGIEPNTTAGGVAKNNQQLAVVNYGSQTVSLFKQQGNSFVLKQVLPTLSQPVSVAFGNNHLYILGKLSIESHKISGDTLEERPDGSSSLLIDDGSAAQVGVIENQLIISQRSNAIEIVNLNNGAVTKTISPVQLPPPPKNKVPVGLVTRGKIAYVTIAHSDEIGIVKDGKLTSLFTTETEHVPCWLALTDSWLFSSNTPSHTISRYKVTDDSITLVEPVAAKIEGLPSDMDIDGGILAVLDTGSGPGHLSQFQIGNDGKLKFLNIASTAKAANGVQVIKLR